MENNLSNDKISAIAFTQNRMFLGTGSGVLFVYDVIDENKFRTSVEFDDKIVLHRSEITKLFYG